MRPVPVPAGDAGARLPGARAGRPWSRCPERWRRAPRGRQRPPRRTGLGRERVRADSWPGSRLARLSRRRSGRRPGRPRWGRGGQGRGQQGRGGAGRAGSQLSPRMPRRPRVRPLLGDAARIRARRRSRVRGRAAGGPGGGSRPVRPRVIHSPGPSHPSRGLERWGLGRGAAYWLRGSDEKQTGQSVSGKGSNYLAEGRVLDRE